MSSELKDLNEFVAVVDNLYSRNKLDELQTLRSQSLQNHDSLKYYYITDYLGFQVEDKHLYNRGKDIFKTLEKQLNSNQEKDRIMGFLKEAENLLSQGITHAPYYRGVLMKYFPKFRDNGDQPVNEMLDSGVKRLFINTYNSYKKQKRK